MLHIAESSAENNKIKDTGVDFISALLLPSKKFNFGTFGYTSPSVQTDLYKGFLASQRFDIEIDSE